MQKLVISGLLIILFVTMMSLIGLVGMVTMFHEGQSRQQTSPTIVIQTSPVSMPSLESVTLEVK